MKPDHLFCMIGKSDPAAMQICFDRRSSRVSGLRARLQERERCGRRRRPCQSRHFRAGAKMMWVPHYFRLAAKASRMAPGAHPAKH